MKITGKSIALMAVLSVCGSYATAKVFSIDSGKILRESREGRSILAHNEKDKKELMEVEYKGSQDINTLRSEIETAIRSGKESQEVLQEKYEELTRLQRKFKHVVEDAREDYKVKEQRRVVKFRTKVHQVAREYFSKKPDSAVFDKNTPGLIFVAESTDRTDSLLTELDVRYKKEQATAALTRNIKTGTSKSGGSKSKKKTT